MFEVGSIVLYKGQCAIVSEKAIDKYVINFFTNNGKKNILVSQKIRIKDAQLLHIGKCLDFNQVIKISEDDNLINHFLEALKDGHELLLSDETTAKEIITIKDLAELTLGNYKVEQCYAIYKAILKSELFSSELKQNNECEVFFVPRDLDEINKIKSKEAEKQKESILRQEFILRLKQKKLQLPEDSKYLQEIEAFTLGKTDKCKILKEANLTENVEKAHKLLIDTGFWLYTKNPYPARNNISLQNCTETLESPKEEERIELDHIAWAIDNPNSTDPDDAIAFDGKYFWVHIADPASTVLPNSKIDKIARDRGATLYIPEGVVRMLSENCLEDYALGLSEPQKKSNALSFRILLNENCVIEDINVFKTKVYVKRLTYEQADQQRHSTDLAPLFDIAERNIQRRKNANAVFIEFPEVEIFIDNDKNVSIKPKTFYQSSIVVREAMLLAGEAAAKFAFKNNLPFPYISQEAPDLPKDLPSGLAGNYKLRRSMRSRSVGITPSSHAGLGLGMYSQVTSPLRRYGDLVAHQQLRAFIDNKPLLDKDSMLERIAAGDQATYNIIKTDRATRLHWTLVYLLQNPSWTGEGICIEQKGKQAFFFIPSLAQETLITTGGSIELNQSVTLRSANINIPELKVDFIIQN